MTNSPSAVSADYGPNRSAPHAVEAEEAILGCVLINPEAYFEVSSFLRSDDFFLHKHRWIWSAFLNLHEQRLPIDILTVSEELERHNQLNEAGGAGYLTRLINSVPTSLHAEAYGRLVEREAMRRRLLEAATEVARLAYEEDREIGEVVNDAEAAIFAVSERRLTKDLSPIKEAISQYYDRIKYLFEHRDEILGVPTGFIDLDKLLGGLQQSDLLIIAGRPGSGKTGLMLNVAKNAALIYKKHVAVFSLEMSNDQLVQRLISQETGIDSQRLRLGDIHDHEWPLFVQAASVLSDAHVFLDDTPALTPNQLRAKCRRLDQEFGLDLVIVDYLQLMQGERRSENRVQEVSSISRSLKQLARELNVPVLAGAQLSRAVEQRADKRPVLSDLRESGCITGDSLVTLAESGSRVPIRELVGRSDLTVWALNPDNLQLEAMPVSRVFPTGTQTVFALTTRLGRYINATGNHKFLTIDGWKRLDELTVGEHIAVPRKIEQKTSSQSMSDAELALLALLIGDGCTLPTHALQFTTREKDMAEIAADLARQVFGAEINPRISPEMRWYQVYLSSTRKHTHGVHSAITDWLTDLGLWGMRSYKKFVPDKVFQQPAGAAAVFLRHLWATDGSIQLIKGKRVRPIAYYASSSARLAGDVQTLLLRLGINARLQRISQNGKGRDQYHVTVTGKPDLLRFGELIGAAGQYRQNRLSKVTGYLQLHVANTNRDVIPRAIWRRHVVPAMQVAGLTSRQMQAALPLAYCGTGLYKQNVSRERAERVARVVNSTELAKLATSDVYWDQIAEIAPGPTEPVFDLTVPGHHNFVVNDIIAHNSLEQDSDIVMFIHRPDMYEKEGSRTNIAEIIVAKHRNGPTADIQLVFRGALTKFENAETRHVDLRNV